MTIKIVREPNYPAVPGIAPERAVQLREKAGFPAGRCVHCGRAYGQGEVLRFCEAKIHTQEMCRIVRHAPDREAQPPVEARAGDINPFADGEG